MERLSGLDASFLYLENPSLHMHVVMTSVVDPATVPGGYSFARMKELIAERLPLAPVFQRRLVEVPLRWGHPVWVDDPDFDIDYHVRLAAVPKPGGLRELAAIAGDIAGRQLDRSKPLWEMWIIEGLANDRVGIRDQDAPLHRGRGVRGGIAVDSLRPRARPGADTPPPPERVHDDRIPSNLELLGTATVDRAMLPFKITRDLVRTGSRVLDVRKVRIGSEERPGLGKAALPLSAPRTSFNGSLSRSRSVAFTAIGLDDVKRLKSAMGTTVNDVVLAVCTGALRSFLLQGDELPSKPLVAVVPVSVRTTTANARGSNKVSSMFVQLPSQLDDPLERLEAIHQGTKGAKEEHNALGADTLLNWAEHATPNLFANAARLYSRMQLADRHRPIANLVISNVPGPDFPLYLGGAELECGFPLGPVMEGMGVNITIMSYRGIMYWGIISCPENMPRVWDLAADIPLALDELLEAANLGRPSTGTKTPPSRCRRLA